MRTSARTSQLRRTAVLRTAGDRKDPFEIPEESLELVEDREEKERLFQNDRLHNSLPEFLRLINGGGRN